MVNPNEIKKYNIWGLVQVRGTGSIQGGRPNRCLWDVCGKPAIEWVLIAMKGSKYIDKLTVCTESEPIKEVVRRIGVQIVDRPYHMALDAHRDFTQGAFAESKPRSLLSMPCPIFVDRTVYATNYLEETEGYMADIRIDVEADGPLVTTEIIDRMVEKFFGDEEADTVSTYYPILPYVSVMNPVTGRMIRLLEFGRREESMTRYGSGTSSVVGWRSKVTGVTGMAGQLAHIIITPEEGLHMHTEEDLFLARAYMARRLKSKREDNEKH